MDDSLEWMDYVGCGQSLGMMVYLMVKRRGVVRYGGMLLMVALQYRQRPGGELIIQ